MEAITRSEIFMAAAAGKGTAPTPITRQEKFLKDIADSIGELFVTSGGDTLTWDGNTGGRNIGKKWTRI